MLLLTSSVNRHGASPANDKESVCADTWQRGFRRFSGSLQGGRNSRSWEKVSSIDLKL